MSVVESFAHFVNHHLKAWPELEMPFDPAWRSPCEISEPYTRSPENQQGDSPRFIRWGPVKRSLPDDFTGLENALETDVHPDIKAYYGAWWSGNLEAEAPDGHVSLILLWNPDDADRLVENQIGHALVNRRSKSPLSFFFACTEPDSDLILTVRNDTGEVLLERPGYKPLRTVAGCLAEFIDLLVPAGAGEGATRRLPAPVGGEGPCGR